MCKDNVRLFDTNEETKFHIKDKPSVRTVQCSFGNFAYKPQPDITPLESANITVVGMILNSYQVGSFRYDTSDEEIKGLLEDYGIDRHFIITNS